MIKDFSKYNASVVIPKRSRGISRFKIWRSFTQTVQDDKKLIIDFKVQSGFSPILLISSLGIGIAILSGILFFKAFSAKPPIITQKSEKITFASPSPVVEVKSSEVSDDEGDNVDEEDKFLREDLEGPD